VLHASLMTMTTNDFRLSGLFLTNSSTAWRYEHYLCSTTVASYCFSS